MSDKKNEELVRQKVSELIAADRESLIGPVSEEKRKEIAKKLPSAYQAFYEKHEFKKGQLVEWKEGMKNKFRPRLREPAIVMEILKTPESDTERDSGSPYFREPLDMIIGVIEEKDDSLLCFHVDKRRFKPFKG
jgi:hypothetical protein